MSKTIPLAEVNEGIAEMRDGKLTRVALIFTALAYGIVAILLVFQMLMRLALIDMLIVLSPVAALLSVLPQTQGCFRRWPTSSR